jgi:hypothetical protein
MSTIDVAFAAVVVTGVGIPATLVNGRADRRHTRQLAHDARIFESRKELYVEILMYGHRTMLNAQHTWPLIEPVFPRPPEVILSPIEELRLEARIAALASSDVQKALRDFGIRQRAFFDYASEVEAERAREPGARPDRAKLDRLRDAVTEGYNAIVELIRAELKTPTGSAPSKLRWRSAARRSSAATGSPDDLAS